MVNNSTHRTSPRTPLRESASVFDRRGARAKRHGARPPARFSSPRSQQSVKQKQEPRVTPFWHNDTPPRVTVTFGARRARHLGGCRLSVGTHGCKLPTIALACGQTNSGSTSQDRPTFPSSSKPPQIWPRPVGFNFKAARLPTAPFTYDQVHD